jgi:hypothetical protein
MRSSQGDEYLSTFWETAFMPSSFDQFFGWLGTSLASLVNMAFLQTRAPGLNGAADWFSPLNLALTVLLGLCLLGSWRSRSPLLAVFLLAGLLNLVASALHLYPFRARPILYLVPLVFLLLSGILDQLENPSRAPSNRSRALGVLLAMFALLPPVTTAARTFLAPTNFADLRSILGHLETERQASERLAISHWSYPAFLYYRGAYGFADEPFRVLPKAEEFAEFATRLPRDRPIWLIFSHRLEEVPELLERLGPHFVVERSYEAAEATAILVRPRIVTPSPTGS